MISMPITKIHRPNLPRFRINTKRTNWSLFQSLILLNDIWLPDEDINTKTDKLTNSIIIAAKSATPGGNGREYKYAGLA